MPFAGSRRQGGGALRGRLAEGPAGDQQHGVRAPARARPATPPAAGRGPCRAAAGRPARRPARRPGTGRRHGLDVAVLRERAHRDARDAVGRDAEALREHLGAVLGVRDHMVEGAGVALVAALAACVAAGDVGQRVVRREDDGDAEQPRGGAPEGAVDAVHRQPLHVDHVGPVAAQRRQQRGEVERVLDAARVAARAGRQAVGEPVEALGQAHALGRLERGVRVAAGDELHVVPAPCECLAECVVIRTRVSAGVDDHDPHGAASLPSPARDTGH